MKRKKVLFFVVSNVGGAERMTVNIAEFLDSSLYEVKIYVIGKDKGKIFSLIPDRISTDLIIAKSFKDLLVLKLFKVLKFEKADIVFSSLMPINWRLCLVSFFFRKLKVIIRANDYLHTQTLIQKLRLFLSYQFADKIIVQTSEMKTEHIRVLKLDENRVLMLPNPINTGVIDLKVRDTVSPYDNSKTNYLFVGRINPVKGIDVLIKSFYNVVKKNPNSHLYIVGESGGLFIEYNQSLLALIDSFDISKNVTFIGFTNNPYVYMKFADCLVLSSRNEGLPNVILESLYLGTPVAVTKSVPVINRIVENGVTGYIVEVDNVNELSRAMEDSVKLGFVASNYKPSTRKDFQEAFNF